MEGDSRDDYSGAVRRDLGFLYGLQTVSYSDIGVFRMPVSHGAGCSIFSRFISLDCSHDRYSIKDAAGFRQGEEKPERDLKERKITSPWRCQIDAQK